MRSPHDQTGRLIAALCLSLGLCATPHARAQSPAIEPTTVSSICPAHCELRDPSTEVTKVVDLNEADESALLDLPGIGPARARAILAFRHSHGAFHSVSQLLQIKGIGRTLLKQLRPLVTL